MKRRTFLTLFSYGTVSIGNLHAINFRESIPSSWKTTNINDTAIALYGKEKFSSIQKSSKITLIAPKAIVADSSAIPIQVISDIKAKSVALIQNANDQSLVAVFTVPLNQTINYSLDIRMERKGTLFVVVEGLDNKLYYVRQFIDAQEIRCSATVQ